MKVSLKTLYLQAMKQLSHKILAVVMAFVVLFSTMSFSISMHYCGDDLVGLAIFEKASTCEEEEHVAHCEMEMMESSSCQMQDSMKMSCEMKKDCCTDKEIQIDSQKDLKNNTLDSFQFSKTVFVVAFVYTYKALFNELETKNNSFLVYHPPPLIKPIYKLDEVYLI